MAKRKRDEMQALLEARTDEGGPDLLAWRAAADRCEEQGNQRGARLLRARAEYFPALFETVKRQAMAILAGSPLGDLNGVTIGNRYVHVITYPTKIDFRDRKDGMHAMLLLYSKTAKADLDAYLTAKLLRLIDWCTGA